MSDKSAVLQRLAEAVSDGKPVDWASESSTHGDLAPQIHGLRLVESISAGHRTLGSAEPQAVDSSEGMAATLDLPVADTPTPDRFWDIVERHRVTQFYTAPTAIRAFMKWGDEHPAKHDLSSLKVLGTVGEPINPEAWMWYHRVIGGERCPIVDTWWQTETGGIMITPLPGVTPTEPGSATRPFLGIVPEVVAHNGRVVDANEGGYLVVRRPWPGMLRMIYGDPERYVQQYWSQVNGSYFTGDGARRDEDGYYWITGRVDDVLNVSGHRLGTAEIESALVLHDDVAEAAVVGYPHSIKGQGIYAYVTLNTGISKTDDLKKELVQLVRTEIGPIATIDILQWADGLPKTRSGKIMRRILKKIAAGEIDDLGDLSTIADPTVIDDLIAESKDLKAEK